MARSLSPGIGIWPISMHKGYTLVEMLVSIAIMSIMMGIVGFSYNVGKQYDTLNLEMQRVASAIRTIRNRDFNGAVAYNGTTNMYPTGGYGLHMENEYNVCTGDTSRSCYDAADCTGFGSCQAGNSKRSSYIIFADFDDDNIFDGGKSGSEYITEVKVAKDFRLVLFNGLTAANMKFKSGNAYYYNTSGSGGALDPAFSIDLQYWPNGTSQNCSKTRNQKARVAVNVSSKNITEGLVACP